MGGLKLRRKHSGIVEHTCFRGTSLTHMESNVGNKTWGTESRISEPVKHRRRYKPQKGKILRPELRKLQKAHKSLARAPIWSKECTRSRRSGVTVGRNKPATILWPNARLGLHKKDVGTVCGWKHLRASPAVPTFLITPPHWWLSLVSKKVLN